MKSVKNKNRPSGNSKFPHKNKSSGFTSWSLKLAVTAALIAVISVAGHRFGIIDFQLALLGLAASGMAGLSAIVIGLTGTWRAKKAQEPEIASTLAGSTLALLVLMPILMAVLAGIGKPLIHDISTDLTNPPEFIAIKALRNETHNSLDRKEPDRLAALQEAAYPDVRPLILERAYDQVFEQAVALVKKRGWEIAAISAANGRIEATDTTFIMGFKDDIVIRIQAEGSKTRVDMRSASRVGKGDLGANAARIRFFLSDLAKD